MSSNYLLQSKCCFLCLELVASSFLWLRLADSGLDIMLKQFVDKQSADKCRKINFCNMCVVIDLRTSTLSNGIMIQCAILCSYLFTLERVYIPMG